MTWNIKAGGQDPGGADRLGAIAAVVGREGPDILALQELRGFGADGGRRMRTLAAATGMRANLVGSVSGQPVAVLVRPSLMITGRAAVRWRLHHAAAVVFIRTAAGPLTVVSTHLNPFSPERRLREARRLAARYASTQRMPKTGLVALAGDLNTLDPDTDHAERLARLAPAYRHRHLAADGTADTRAIAALTENGLVDLWTLVGEGDGLTAPTTGGGGAEFSGMRLDYVLASPPLAGRATSARVVRGGSAEYASDHYPLVVDVDL